MPEAVHDPDDQKNYPFTMPLEDLAREAYRVRSLDLDMELDLDSPGKRHEYADYLEKVLAMRTTIHAAEVQAQTNEDLVSETKRLVDETQKLAKETRTVATWTIIVGIATVVLVIITFLVNG